MGMFKRGLIGTIIISVLSCCSPVSKETNYYFDEKNGSYDQCKFFGYIDGRLIDEMKFEPYFAVIGHGFEKKVNGFWVPSVYQWRSKKGHVITFVARDGTGSTDSPGYWYGTLNGQRAGGYTVVPRFHWMFDTWNGDAEFECRNPGEEGF